MLWAAILAFWTLGFALGIIGGSVRSSRVRCGLVVLSGCLPLLAVMSLFARDFVVVGKPLLDASGRTALAESVPLLIITIPVWLMAGMMGVWVARN